MEKIAKKSKTTKKVADKKQEIRKKILFVASEAQPFCATGGLADVCGSLPKEIVSKDNSIEIRTILPLYSNISEKYRKNFKFIGHTYVNLSWRNEYCGVFEWDYQGIHYYFLDNERYFKRDDGEYGYFDDCERFAFFSKAVLEALTIIDYEPDIIHVNDWQSALIPTYLKVFDYPEKYKKIKTILNIHNIQFQGRYGYSVIGDVIGIPEEHAGILTYDNDCNILKGAIVTADQIITVSPSYAEEIKTPEHSHGLHKIVRENAYKLKGILNGLDYEFYNPATDTVIYANYSKTNMKNKAKCKEELQKEMGLEVNPDVPIIAFVSRITAMKGFNLVKECLEKLLVEHGIQVLGVGSGDPEFMEYFNYINKKFPKQAHISLGFSSEIGKKIYSGADIYIMPSLTEPCGLSQMIASIYGVVPIVREVGGLKDTIIDFGCIGGGNGYTFKNAEVSDFEYSVKRAIKDYKDPDEWTKKVKIVMSQDFSWEKTAKEYVNVYNNI